MQSQSISWLTPQRMRRLTIGAMCAAGIVSTIGFSGSTPPVTAHSSHAGAAIVSHHSSAR
ncbi:MAG: hypothetical protein ABR992_03075 [Solirubrobacteraceae bacterium]